MLRVQGAIATTQCARDEGRGVRGEGDILKWVGVVVHWAGGVMGHVGSRTPTVGSRRVQNPSLEVGFYFWCQEVLAQPPPQTPVMGQEVSSLSPAHPHVSSPTHLLTHSPARLLPRSTRSPAQPLDCLPTHPLTHTTKPIAQFPTPPRTNSHMLTPFPPPPFAHTPT